jgi:flagellum-specific ATP synthase
VDWKINNKEYWSKLSSAMIYNEAGKVTKSLGLVYEAHLPGASIGSICRIHSSADAYSKDGGVLAEAVGFKDEYVILMPFDDILGVSKDSLVTLETRSSTYEVSQAHLGRVIDGKGDPIDGKGPIEPQIENRADQNLYEKPEAALSRPLITEPLDLGVRSLNGLLTTGKGQRVGIMAGSGVGKSVLLGMMARNTAADINVIALIGERGREVREFIERDLGEESLKKSVVIVATSDTSPLMRMRGAFLAASVAEYFRDQGNDVLLMMDSVTRFCMAQREIGLSMGEPPASKGYTPSVFAKLPKLLERSGMGVKGSITGLFTVLVEGDDLDNPVADAARSILDGHIVLSRRFAERGHFPAVDILQSTSRVMNFVINDEHKKWAMQIREWISLYAEVEDLINIGAYVRGANQKVDQAVFVNERVNKFLKQEISESLNYDQTLAEMQGIYLAGQAFLASMNAAESADPKSSGGPGLAL